MANEEQLGLALPVEKREGARNRDEPTLWVKELAVYSDWNADALLRNISLRTGLNIIWARPGKQGASGHAAGKTTFCRFLRYLLGDAKFGTEVFREAFRNKFPNAWLVGEARLNGTSWLLARPLTISGGYHWCVEGASFGQLFEEELHREAYKEFTNAVSEATVARLAATDFPGTSRAIEWRHLLEWLTRDQEARFSHLLAWRSSLSESEGHGELSQTDRTNLLRLVLDVLDSYELKQQRRHANKLAEKQEIDKEIPNLHYTYQRHLKTLAKQHQELEEPDTDPQSKLLEIRQSSKRELERLQEREEELSDSDGVGEVLLETWRQRLGQVERLKSEVESDRRQAERLQLDLAFSQKKLSQEDYRRQAAALGPIDGLCSVELQEAHEYGCPLAPLPNRDEVAAQRLESLRSDTTILESRAQSIMEQLERRQVALRQVEAQELESRQRIQNIRKQHQFQVRELRKTLTEAQIAFSHAESALVLANELADKREARKKAESDLSKQRKALSKHRNRSTASINLFNDTFGHLASTILGDEVAGSVLFESDGVHPELHHQGDLTSAALVTLKIILFDLAALLTSAGGDHHHPGFLLHDSPREADLSAGIYHRVFETIRSQESPEQESPFQYILTTTEPPPEALQRQPWLVHPPFSSTSPEDRFLGVIV